MKLNGFRFLFFTTAFTFMILFCSSQVFSAEPQSEIDASLSAEELVENAKGFYIEGMRLRKEAKQHKKDSTYDSNYKNSEWLETDSLVNLSKCYSYLKKSAELGNPKGQCLLGKCYENGVGIPKSVTSAAEWYEKSAEQGYARGQYQLGMCFFTGDGVPKNDTEQFKWFLKSAQQGNAKAQEMLGICYAKGEGVALDNVTAYMWFNLSIATGNTDATERRDRMIERMTPKQIAEGQKLSSEWKPK